MLHAVNYSSFILLRKIFEHRNELVTVVAKQTTRRQFRTSGDNFLSCVRVPLHDNREWLVVSNLSRDHCHALSSIAWSKLHPIGHRTNLLNPIAV